jgi:hypothetical protein
VAVERLTSEKSVEIRSRQDAVAMIFLISDKQRVSIELHVADKYPLVVLFTPPELDSRVKNFDPPQVFPVASSVAITKLSLPSPVAEYRIPLAMIRRYVFGCDTLSHCANCTKRATHSDANKQPIHGIQFTPKRQAMGGL